MHDYYTRGPDISKIFPTPDPNITGTRDGISRDRLTSIRVQLSVAFFFAIYVREGEMAVVSLLFLAAVVSATVHGEYFLYVDCSPQQFSSLEGQP